MGARAGKTALEVGFEGFWFVAGFSMFGYKGSCREIRCWGEGCGELCKNRMHQE